MACIPYIVVVLSRTNNDVFGGGNYTCSGSAQFIQLINALVKLEYLISIDGATLVVYRVEQYFQYEILFWDGSIFKPQEIYNTAVKASEIGIDRIKTTIGY